MKLESIEKKSNLSKSQFKKEHLIPAKPVVFKDLIDVWPAYQKWTFDYFISKYGEVRIPVYDKSFSRPGKNYMAPTGQMPLGEYLKLIQSGPCDIRIFLLNILKLIPELKSDLGKLEIMEGFMDRLPFMFFGGQGSYTKIHYDLDCAHVFLTHFQTRKRVVLFAPDQSHILGHLPYTVGCLIDPMDADETRYPSLAHLKGYETVLEHGETLFIPSKFWHHIEYTDAGFSISYRAFESVQQKLNGLFHIGRHFVVDRTMNLIFGEKWSRWKIEQAEEKREHFNLA
ncbi:MAG: cupin-like domain-containing protein [Saprospiraceae bacterium]|nr:cupin-like domain-containing protein [Saprospiraceae bacterium]MBK7811616.1 cupin-like domain-containing protein [Saprospiraceae bacterium]